MGCLLFPRLVLNECVCLTKNIFSVVQIERYNDDGKMQCVYLIPYDFIKRL